jgi:hypothetical protein
VADTRTDAIAMFMETMERLLGESGPKPQDIVMPERLDRSKLDFSLGSLNVIDDYLNVVHGHEQTSVGSSLLTTIWVASLYVGEIIRRAAGHRCYQWVTLGDESPPGAGTTTTQVDLGSLRALRAQDGEMCLPSRAVLRVILRGRKARSVHSFARGAIESSSAEAEPARSAMAAPSARRTAAAFA